MSTVQVVLGGRSGVVLACRVCSSVAQFPHPEPPLMTSYPDRAASTQHIRGLFFTPSHCVSTVRIR